MIYPSSGRIFLVRAYSLDGGGESRPFSTEALAVRYVEEFGILEHQGEDGLVVEEHEVDFLLPVEHPNLPGEQILPVSLRRVVARWERDHRRASL